ncbi:dihydroneopterin aldolase [Candidatus Peregrinibacteria bacterium]|nr:dihydroneopterin aldolase [Candidatus Peregrinibacteria bacterium]
MEDSISLEAIIVQSHIGVTAAERASAQTLHVSVTLCTDTAKAGRSDDIADTIDYDRVADTIRGLGATERSTLEKFAEDAAGTILEKFAPQKVTISVTKPNISGSKGATVTITRP